MNKREYLEPPLCVREAHTAWGWVQVTASAAGLVHVAWPRETASPPPAAACPPAAETYARQALAEIAAYLAGERQEFTVPLAGEGTAFTRRVWEACRRIPYGETRSYGWLAAQIGCPRGARAVGQALGRNPTPLLIPCHRVIAADGGLGGFGGGNTTKRRLLALERPPRR